MTASGHWDLPTCCAGIWSVVTYLPKNGVLVSDIAVDVTVLLRICWMTDNLRIIKCIITMSSGPPLKRLKHDFGNLAFSGCCVSVDITGVG